MHGFVDETFIQVSTGRGGDGAVSFRREKYVPRGGPDGGDGGDGGDVVFVVKNNVKTLSHLKSRRVYKAGDGERGKGRRKHGKNGEDVFIKVPPGTIIREDETGEVVCDLLQSGQTYVYARGGKGGKGNWHFRTSTRRAPRFAVDGEPPREARLRVELNLIADAGFVGFPNAGKSTLLSVLTNAHPKIGSYPFTTKIPNLGIYRTDDAEVVFADIPGIIEGAHEGAGLGLTFLKHISRTKVLVFLIDVSDPGYLDAFSVLRDELSGFSRELAGRKRIVAANKIDTEEGGKRLRELKAAIPTETVLGISALTRTGLKEFLAAVMHMVNEAG